MQGVISEGKTLVSDSVSHKRSQQDEFKKAGENNYQLEELYNLHSSVDSIVGSYFIIVIENDYGGKPYERTYKDT